MRVGVHQDKFKKRCLKYTMNTLPRYGKECPLEKVQRELETLYYKAYERIPWLKKQGTLSFTDLRYYELIMDGNPGNGPLIRMPVMPELKAFMAEFHHPAQELYVIEPVNEGEEPTKKVKLWWDHSNINW